MSLLGLAMVILSFVVFDKETVAYCLRLERLENHRAKPGTIVHFLLRLLVGIGLISYSAYLWHQPLLAFARHRWFDVIPSQEAIILCLGLVFALYISSCRS